MYQLWDNPESSQVPINWWSSLTTYCEMMQLVNGRRARYKRQKFQSKSVWTLKLITTRQKNDYWIKSISKWFYSGIHLPHRSLPGFSTKSLNKSSSCCQSCRSIPSSPSHLTTASQILNRRTAAHDEDCRTGVSTTCCFSPLMNLSGWFRKTCPCQYCVLWWVHNRFHSRFG